MTHKEIAEARRVLEQAIDVIRRGNLSGSWSIPSNAIKALDALCEAATAAQLDSLALGGVMRNPDETRPSGEVRFGSIWILRETRFAFSKGGTAFDVTDACRMYDRLRKEITDLDNAIQWYESIRRNNAE